MENGRVRDKKRFIVFLCVLCFLVMALVVGIVVFNLQNLSERIETEVTQDTDEAEDKNSEALEPSGLDADDYITEMENRIKTASSDEDKASLYSVRAATLYNKQLNDEGDFLQQILKDAYMADLLSPTAQNAYRIYTYENELGDKIKAEEYLEKAQERGMELDSELRG